MQRIGIGNILAAAHGAEMSATQLAGTKVVWEPRVFSDLSSEQK